MVDKENNKIESATYLSRGGVGSLGTAILFIVGMVNFTEARFAEVEQPFLLVAAAVIGACMVMNIGANDAANNVGPAVGSFALSLTGARLIAAIFEAAEAFIAGVVKTAMNGIVDPADLGNTDDHVWVMMGTLPGAAIWRNGVAWLGAPVSTTHSIVGGVMGASVAAAGTSSPGVRGATSPRAGSSRR